MRDNMFYGATPMIFQRAEELRNRMTLAEEKLWHSIRINEWRLKFRRQHPIANYVVDFYCHPIKLVIELDGGIHEVEEVKKYDEFREQHLRELGLTVLRFKNNEIIENKKATLEMISQVIMHLQSAPLGDGGKKLFIIKIGGNVIDDEKNLSSFLDDFAAIKDNKMLIHGGGKIATKIGEQLGIESKYVNGRRITDAATIDLVTMAYGGLVNKKIVSLLQAKACNAIGLTGADANILPATKRPVKEIDYGFVGDIEEGSSGVANLELLLKHHLTPVIAPLTHDGKGQMLNTNADTIAAVLAVDLSKKYAVRLIYCFEKKGVLKNVKDENSVIPIITKESYRQLLNAKKLFEGILPKVENALSAIDKGVQEVLIGDAKDLLQNITTDTRGTLIQ
jgi:acetylglutamate kinase